MRPAKFAFAALTSATLAAISASARADVSSTAPTPPPASTTAADSEPSATGFSFGLRAGYSLPVGLVKDTSIRNVVTGAVPIGVDGGYFLTPHLYVGAYLIYGFGVVAQGTSNTCNATDADLTCSASTIRFGAVARWHFRPLTSYDPWVGGGFGYDIINLSATDSTGATDPQSGSDHGLELLNLQGGLDVKPRAFYGFGPFAEVSMGHYASETSSTSMHAWFTLGVRLRTGL